MKDNAPQPSAHDKKKPLAAQSLWEKLEGFFQKGNDKTDKQIDQFFKKHDL